MRSKYKLKIHVLAQNKVDRLATGLTGVFCPVPSPRLVAPFINLHPSSRNARPNIMVPADQASGQR